MKKLLLFIILVVFTHSHAQAKQNITLSLWTKSLVDSSGIHSTVYITTPQQGYVKTTDEDGYLQFTFATGVENRPDTSPKNFHLSSNYPNPFAKETRVDVQTAFPVVLRIYNLLGRLVYAQSLAYSSNVSIDLSGHSSGVFFLCAFDDRGTLLDKRKMFLLNGETTSPCKSPIIPVAPVVPLPKKIADMPKSSFDMIIKTFSSFFYDTSDTLTNVKQDTTVIIYKIPKPQLVSFEVQQPEKFQQNLPVKAVMNGWGEAQVCAFITDGKIANGSIDTAKTEFSSLVLPGVYQYNINIKNTKTGQYDVGVIVRQDGEMERFLRPLGDKIVNVNNPARISLNLADCVVPAIGYASSIVDQNGNPIGHTSGPDGWASFEAEPDAVPDTLVFLYKNLTIKQPVNGNVEPGIIHDLGKITTMNADFANETMADGEGNEYHRFGDLVDVLPGKSAYPNIGTIFLPDAGVATVAYINLTGKDKNGVQYDITQNMTDAINILNQKIGGALQNYLGITYVIPVPDGNNTHLEDVSSISDENDLISNLSNPKYIGNNTIILSSRYDLAAGGNGIIRDYQTGSNIRNGCSVSSTRENVLNMSLVEAGPFFLGSADESRRPYWKGTFMKELTTEEFKNFNDIKSNIIYLGHEMSKEGLGAVIYWGLGRGTVMKYNDNAGSKIITKPDINLNWIFL